MLNRLFACILLIICIVFIFNVDVLSCKISPTNIDMQVYQCYFREQFTNIMED